jgi:hypothetical protein
MKNPTDNAKPDVSLWSSRTRLLVGALIVAWLFLIVMGPMTNPIATEELTAPIGRFLRPAHQTLFMGHGYRFFAPDPGPNHILTYRIYRNDELVRDDHFPDRNREWPRVIYHRWFMLSETLFAEHSRTPDAESFEKIRSEFKEEIAAFERANQTQLAKSAAAILDRQERSYALTQKRIKELVDAVGRELLKRYDGDRVELFLQERRLLTPAESVVGKRPDDLSLLSERLPIGIVPREGGGQ